MSYRLKNKVTVAEKRSEPCDIIELPAGTALEDIDPEQLAQLAPDHFIDEAGHPPTSDWRDDEAILADREAAESRAELQAEVAAERARLDAEKEASS